MGNAVQSFLFTFDMDRNRIINIATGLVQTSNNNDLSKSLASTRGV